MEVEGNEPLVTERIPKKHLVKKGINELSANLYGAETGLLDTKAFTQFYNDLQSATATEDQIRLITVLNKTSPELINKFVNFKGMELVTDVLAKACLRPQEKGELLEKLLTFLNKITLTPDILDRTKIHVLLENMRKTVEMPENLCSMPFKLLAKWRRTIDDWENERNNEISPERHQHGSPNMEEDKRSPDYDDDHGDHQGNRNFIKRTYDRNRDRPNIKEDNGRDQRFGDRRRPGMMMDRRDQRDQRRREGSPPRGGMYRQGPRFERRPHSNSGWNRGRRSNSSESEDEDRSPKKNVKWVEEPKLCSLKFFRFNDEPTAKGLTEEEVMQIRQRMMNEGPDTNSFHNSEEYKHKESLMEMKHKKESEKEIEEKLSKMQEKIKWSRPIKINIGEDNMFSKHVGKESIEAEKQQKRISSKLQCLYLKDYQIPEQPSHENLETAPPSDDSEPTVIPLHNINELEDIVHMIEQKIHEEEQKTEKKEEEVKLAEENKTTAGEEAKKVEKKPIKGILKKSKEELKRIRQEEKREAELKKQAEESRMTQEMLSSIVPGEIPEDIRQMLLVALKDSKNSKNTIENIKILLEAKQMQHQQQTQPMEPRLGPNPNYTPSQPRDSQFGDFTHKRVKMNPDNFNPHQGGPPQQFGMQGNPNYPNQKFPMQQDSKFQSMGHDDDFQSGDQSKRPYKPQNYKTVPCRLFHSPQGCQYGDNCHYIHDLNYAGRETPNMHKYVRPMHNLNKPGGRMKEDGMDLEHDMGPPPHNDSATFERTPKPFRGQDGPDRFPGGHQNPPPFSSTTTYPSQQQPKPTQPQTSHFPPFQSQQQHPPQQQPHHTFSQPPPQQQQQHLQQTPPPFKKFPPEGRPNFQQNIPNQSGPSIPQKPSGNIPYNNPRPQPGQSNYYNPLQQTQPPPFSQPMQTFSGSGGPPPQHQQYPTTQQPPIGKMPPLNQQHGPPNYQPNQQPPHIQNRGPPPLPQFGGPSGGGGFGSNPSYPPRMQGPGSGPYNLNTQYKPPISGPGPGGYYPGFKDPHNTTSMEQKPVRDPKSELDTIKEVNNKPDIEPVVIKSFKSKLHFIRDDYLDADIGIKGDIDSGLTAEQVQKRRAEGDVNEFPALEPLPFISRLFCCTSRPHTQDEYAAIARKHLSHTSKVIRNNKIVTIPREELVPGDILLLTKGDRVNADVKLLQITDEEKPIYVKMFLYTESKEPVLKEIIHSIGKLWDRQEFILAGSEVVSGAGRALVLAVGKNTAIGQIMTSFEQRMAPRLYRGSTETADTTNGLAGVKSA